MSAPHPRPADGPLFDVEDKLRCVVDRLKMLNEYFEQSHAGVDMTESMARSVSRLIGEAFVEACAVETALDAEFGSHT